MRRACVLLAALSVAAANGAHADPSQSSIARDVVRAHREKVAGATLMGIGSAVAFIGQIFLIYAAVTPEASHAHCGPPGCGPPGWNVAFTFLGEVFLGTGGGLQLVGLPIYVVGAVQKGRAERATITVAPQLSVSGASLIARIRF
jgi:hypothetical protein